jgi:ABC-type nitrate/sulfonate/bicarbonate transport system permease component
MPESRLVRPVPYRGGGFDPKSNRWVSLLTFVSVLAFWEVSSRSGWVSELFLPAPSSAAMALVELYNSGQLMLHISASMQRLSIGWSLGIIFGIVFGFSAGLFSLARAGVVPLVSAVFPIPKIALLPLFIIWFGIGEESKVATIFFGTFFPTVISTFGGVDSVDRGLIRMGQSFNLNWLSIVLKIILPGALPAILSGMRISAAIAIILLVAAEMIGAEFGIGAYVLLAGNLMATDQLIAGVSMLSILGLIFAWLVGQAERYLLRWRG